jgi:hypothetical protein
MPLARQAAGDWPQCAILFWFFLLLLWSVHGIGGQFIMLSPVFYAMFFNAYADDEHEEIENRGSR